MDDTVGSLTQFQKSVVIGTLLGDGYIRQMPGRRDAFLEVNHSVHQKEYVDWKYEVLSNISKSKPKERKGNGKRIAYRFYTQQMPEMTTLMYNWYEGGEKRIPKELSLDPIILAVWFMDDGSMCGTSNCYFNTQQFHLYDQQMLITQLKKIGLKATLNKDKHYHRIRLLSSSIPLLGEIIEQHLISSMKYKLGYNPVETTRRSPALDFRDRTLLK